MDEWFSDRLRHHGHSPLYTYTKGRRYALIDNVLRKLARHDLTEVIDFHISGAVVPSEDIMARLPSEGIFFAPWTSFRSDRRIYFAFTLSRDAIQFRLMWPN